MFVTSYHRKKITPLFQILHSSQIQRTPDTRRSNHMTKQKVNQKPQGYIVHWSPVSTNKHNPANLWLYQ